MDDLTVEHNLLGFGEHVSEVRKDGTCIATFRDANREANAKLFLKAQHMGELVEAAKSFLGRYLDQFPGDKNPLAALSAKLRTAIATIDGEPSRCGSARDGECSAWHCPQNANGEPHRSGRSCPLIWSER